ncbi:MAG: hypothetical protein BGO98_40600 [Myxococcales bacterium 68-20]|nr:MAG: hypothetical protein BGO98_40600 [Myxococcales bacterium 68-20]
MTACATGGAVASCSSDDDTRESEPGDAGWEASATTEDAAVLDGGAADASPVPVRDAAPFDGGPLPVVCASAPCAKSLVTTRAPTDFDRSQGYCVLLDDGTVACWGANAAGQLGRGSDAGTADSAIAERVVGLSDVAQLDHTCALDTSGAVWCWGTGPFLRNDAGAATTERTPLKLALPPATRVGMGSDVGCAVVDDGVLCWGRNTSGVVAPFDVAASFSVLPPRAIGVPSGAPIRDIAVGKAVFVIREDGVTLSWGANPPLARVSSLSPDPQPLPIALGGISSIDMTSDTACATVAGIGYCWGQAIASPIYVRALPTPVVAPEPIVRIATTRSMFVAELGDSIVQPQRWCAVGASGSVYCWGNNASGQAGDGTKEYAFEAVKVEGLPEPAAEVKTTADTTCALLTNGKVFCWGANYYGQLGNGKMRVPSLVPQEVVLP